MFDHGTLLTSSNFYYYHIVFLRVDFYIHVNTSQVNTFKSVIFSQLMLL